MSILKKPITGYWTVERLQKLGCRLIHQQSLWVLFEYKDFIISINLNFNTRYKGNYFNFRSKPNRFKGHFNAILNTEEDFCKLLNFIA